MNLSQIQKNSLPRHIAIIMDGNGRWAELHGNERIHGHKHGVEAVRSVVEGAGEAGIKFLTLYAFSTENWDRPKEEVNALMSLLVNAIIEETDNLCEKNVRMLAIGDILSLPAEAQLQLKAAVRRTSVNTGLTLVLALSYSGRWEILEAVNRIIRDIKTNKISNDWIDETFFEKYLSTAGIPDPELMIRTSGEYRISNFLLWQLAYTELYFSPKLWPDYRKEDLFEAIFNFQHRERRFGKTSEQIKI